MAVTSEFAEAIESKRMLRVRIMLKDLLLIDPTAAQFDEAEAYASVYTTGTTAKLSIITRRNGTRIILTSRW